MSSSISISSAGASSQRVVVDLDGLEELALRLHAASGVLEEVCAGLGSLGGLVVGAHTVHDAVGDLSTSWDRATGGLDRSVRALHAGVTRAQQEYGACEVRVGGLVGSPVPAWGPRW